MSRGQSEHGTVVEHTSEEPTDANVGADIGTRMYGIVADVRVSGPDVLFTATLEQVPEMTIEPRYRAGSGGDDSLFFAAVGPELERFEAAMVEDPSVTSPVRVADNVNGRVYRVQPVHESPVLPSTIDAEVRVREWKLDVDGWHLRMQFPDRDGLVAFNSYCRDHDLNPQVVRLCEAGEEGSCDIPGLTDEQFRLLQSAYDGGYYEMPREISQEELAEEFRISPSGVSQRLRRATADLVASMLVTGYCK